MTQEEKQLLLVDLCARLPYGVIIDSKKYNESNYRKHYPQRLFSINAGQETLVCVDEDDYPDPKCRKHELEYCKPYLRQMSSMTEEETIEYNLLANHCIVTSVGFIHLDANELMDWLNKKMFDYRGLIEKGLALEAPEGLYDTKTK